MEATTSSTSTDWNKRVKKVNHYLAVELENADKKRKFNPSKMAIHESKSDPNDMDQDMPDSNPQGIGSSSTDAALQSKQHGRRDEQEGGVPTSRCMGSM